MKTAGGAPQSGKPTQESEQGALERLPADSKGVAGWAGAREVGAPGETSVKSRLVGGGFSNC